MIPNKGVLSTPQFVFATPFHKGKPQDRVRIDIDEFYFCKEKGHCKAQCLGSKASKKNFKSPSSNIVATASSTIGSGSDHVYSSETTSQIYDIEDELQKILSTQSCAMSDSFIKDPHSGSLIGISRRQVGLYVLDELRVPDTASSKLTHIDPFGHNDNVASDYNFENCRTDTTSTLYIDIPFVPTATQDPSAIVDPPPPRYPSRDRKSTQLPDFVYYTYSTYFSSFLTFIHSLSEPSSYKEAILDPLLQQAMTEELSASHKTNT
ncbi:hypothetical protein KIW84_023840 [Lathyrus oleraceus]|uniref:Uncharacterized protein n=1 Tax=Pisum sativum TaxID=3888 RepID=A0A9D5B702_PEA|nr:hypothetical protein KIW84_023840 [Pisum sativum]